MHSSLPAVPPPVYSGESFQPPEEPAPADPGHGDSYNHLQLAPFQG